VSRVRDYYQANTWKFLLFGAEGAIHRELWAPGVTSKGEAVHHVHGLVLEELRTVNSEGRARVLDLGCGVGSAALFLAERAPAQVYGVTLSPQQVALARRWAAIRQPRLLGACTFDEADFCALPQALEAEIREVDLAFSIEAFVHAEDAGRFFAQVSRVLRLGGHLVIVDDFLADDARPDAPPLEDFRNGWQVHSLLRVPDLSDLASSHGLRLAGSVDLSPFQRLGRPRDRLIHALRPVLRLARRHSEWAESLVGGDALQASYRLGLLNYRLVRFEQG
jgi:SAM-dependent methyltransferase